MQSTVISIGVVVFLFVFRPFGLVVDSVSGALLLIGFAPLNFLIMLGLHAFAFRKRRWRTPVALGALVVANTAYLLTWSQSGREFETGLSVMFVVILTAAIAVLWNRGRIPPQELGEAGGQSAADTSVRLSGESDQEILQLASDDLLFMSANGNYVDVHYRSNDEVAKSMLRCTLVGLVAQLPGTLLTQCHRSHFVNLSVARRVVRARGRTLIEFDGGERVPVSRNYRQQVLTAISA